MAADVAGQMSGLFFHNYLKELLTKIPPFGMIQEKVAVKEETKVGDGYFVPITLGLEQGVTFSKSGNGAFDLNMAVDAEVQQAQVQSAQHVVSSEVSYQGSAASIAPGTAVAQTIKTVSTLNMIKARKTAEINFIYGQGVANDDASGLGKVEAIAGNVLTITAATWAGAIWAGMKRQFVIAVSPDLVTKRNGASGTYQITSVNTAARQITLNAVTAIVVGDYLFYGGKKMVDGTTANDSIVPGATPVFHECAGLHKQLSTTTGTLFGLDYGLNDVLQGNVLSMGFARLTHEKIQEAVAATMDHGNDSPKMVCLVSTLAWSRANADLSANRRYDASYTPAEANEGVEAIRYRSPIGTIELVAHPFVKQGYAYGFAWNNLMRPGETDLTYNRVVGNASRFDPSGAYFRDLETKAGYQLRGYHSSAIYHPISSLAFVIKDIDNT